jgi:hypothetical protein
MDSADSRSAGSFNFVRNRSTKKRARGKMSSRRCRRGDGDFHHAQTIVEILAEGPAGHAGRQIAVGGCKHAHVDGPILALAHATNLSFLQDAQAA